MLMQSPDATVTRVPTRPQRVPLWLAAAMAAIALVALAIPLLLVTGNPRVPVKHAHRPAVVAMPQRVVPKTELPPVEPVELQAVDPTDAKAINAEIPFSTLPNPAARPFRIFGAAESQARAVDCLAAGVYYEAGDDAVGERAVAQVILNRVRHPAFPKTVCGVVFQGSERSTGCQFTFTCDGAILRYSPTAAGWKRAQDIARLALTGSVYADVGHATHYHTDWVIPYWRSSLEKITEIHTHLFYRWAGWWGTPPAFNRAYTGVEPNEPLMSRLSPAHTGDPALLGLPGMPTIEGSLAVDPDAIPAKDVPTSITGDANSYLVTLPKGMNADSFASLAIRTCGDRPYCKFMAWTDSGKTPPKLPLSSAQVASMSFSYLRDQNTGFAKALWNCDQFKRPSPVQCMRAQLLGRPLPGATPAPAATPGAPEAAVPALGGVRRKPEAPSPGATPGARPAVSFTIPVVPRPSPSPTPTGTALPH